MDAEQLDHLLSQIEAFVDGVTDAFGPDPLMPSPTSPAQHEIDTFESPISVRTALSQGHLLLESSADHLIALRRAMALPILTIAPWTIGRALLEAAAYAVWLLDATIGAQERVRRSFCRRIDGLNHQLKFAKCSGNSQAMDQASARLVQVEDDANKLGYRSIRDRKNALVGFDSQLPSKTQVTRDFLEEESAYRLLSAVTHGHSWALQQAGFSRRSSDGVVSLEKDIQPLAILFLAAVAVRNFTRAIASFATLYGIDATAVMEDAAELQTSILNLGDLGQAS